MMDIQRVNSALTRAIVGLQEAEMFPMAFQVVLDGTPDVPPWDLVAEAYGASWAWTQKPQKYTGMMGPRYKAALEKGYVDLGLVDPQIAKQYRRGPKNLPGDILDVMQQSGTAFIRDPEGVLGLFGLTSGTRLADRIRQEVIWMYEDEAGLADERDDFDTQALLIEAIRRAQAAKITLAPVKGRTGAGWKVTMKPSPDEIEISLGL